MTYQISVSNDAIHLHLALEKVTFLAGGQPVTLLKLPMPLCFSRKAANLSELGGGEPAMVYVLKRIDMAPLGYDHFARNLSADHDWLEGQCMALPIANARACLVVVSEGRPVLFVDTQGYSYARYVARLG
jgi:hypothetical protein